LRTDVSVEADVQVRVVLVQKDLELVVTQLVARFELAVVLRVLLNGVIREMNQFVCEVLNGVLSTGCSQVAFFINEAFHVAVH